MKIRKNFVYTGIILFIIVISIVILFANHRLNELRHLVMRLRWGWIYIALTAMLLYYFLDAAVLHSITMLVERRQRFGRSIRLAMIGHFFNAITPFASGGQPVQAYCMVKENIEPARGIIILVMKSMFFQLVVFFYIIIAFVLNGTMLQSLVPQFTTLFLIAAGTNAVLICFFALVLFKHDITARIVNLIFRLLSRLRVIKHPEKITLKITEQLEIYREAARVYRQNWRSAIPIALLEVFRLTAQFSIPYFMYRALESGPMSFMDMLTAMSVVTVLATVFPTPGGSGGAEGISYIFFHNVFVSTPVVPVVLLWRLITYYLHIALGGVVTLVAPEKPFNKWREDSARREDSMKRRDSTIENETIGPHEK